MRPSATARNARSGAGIEEIAAEEGVTYNAVKHSILWREARTPRTELLAGRPIRLRLQAFARLSERYLDELAKLIGDPNPIIRSRALEHFRKTVGLEGTGGMQVSVQQTAVLQTDRPHSFEEAIDAVRRSRMPDPEETVHPNQSTPSSTPSALERREFQA